jgi:hypothetical protein
VSEELTVVDAAPLMPMSMGTTFHAYKAMQGEIDKAMPDQIMTIQGRQFRKKGYWRAVRAAFGLKVWCVSEERIESGADWGYSVLYRAEAKNGMSADGDGVCMASEKAERQRTIHNVRSHAHTRAFNRSVSNLVGFGEVSAEEMQHDDAVVVAEVAKPRPAPAPAQQAPPQMAPVDDVPFDPTEFLEPALYVERVVTTEGKSAQGPWTRYDIFFTDGSNGSTFKDEIGRAAQSHRDTHTKVITTLEANPKYKGKMTVVQLLKAE